MLNHNTNDHVAIKALTAALRNSDVVCEYCVGCQALGRASYEDCLADRAKDFVFDTERVAKDFGIIAS
jgi:hypothetical protein